MRLKGSIVLFSISLLLPSLLITSCGDDPVSGLNKEDVPPPPNFNEIDMDLSVFDAALNSSSAMQSSNSYTEAAYTARAAELSLTALATWPNILFQENQWGDAELRDGVFTWEYSYAFEGEGMSFVVTADELANGDTDWQLRFSLQTAEDNIENALFLRAIISADGQEGRWTIYNMDNPDEALGTLTFEKEDDVPVYIKFELSEDEFDASQILYEVDGTMSSLIFKDSGQTESEIHWNNATGSGCITKNGEESCWNENYEDQ
ncbi:MAG: hypothetical protein WD491_04685 [Balneolales bacterium]